MHFFSTFYDVVTPEIDPKGSWYLHWRPHRAAPGSTDTKLYSEYL